MNRYHSNGAVAADAAAAECAAEEEARANRRFAAAMRRIEADKAAASALMADSPQPCIRQTLSLSEMRKDVPATTL